MQFIVLLFITSLVCISNIVLVFLHIKERSKLKEKEAPITPEWAAKEASQIISSATEKADTLITHAELESLKVVTESDISVKLFEDRYKETVAKALDLYQKEYTQHLDHVKKAYDKHLEDVQKQTDTLENKIDEFVKQSVTKLMTNFEDNLKTIQERAVSAQIESETTMKNKITELLFNFEQSLTNFLSQTEQKSVDAINLELKSARQLIDTYKEQQLAIVDENIISVLERTLTLVLRQKLSLQDQMDMVFDSLEKAKVEKFFA